MASNVGAGTSMSIGDGKQVLTQRQGNGSYRTYFGLQVPENFYRDGTVDLQDVEATRRRLLSDFYADWSDEYKDLIRHATDLRAWPLYTLSTEDISWKSVPGLTLAGDAAHVTIPNGEGVNLAMTDSLKLASKIVEHGTENLDQAVQEYEADMFPRGIASINAGKTMGDAMYSEGPQVFLQLMSS
jgi:2-polyprenyl-6-methoxyphenol hydroxylase-like FAD-dependent oxidoreductase